MFLALRKSPKDLTAFGRCFHLSLKKLQKTWELYSGNGVNKDQIHMSYCVIGKVRHTDWLQYSSALVLSSGHDTAITISSHGYMQWACARLVLSMDKGRAHEAHPFLLIYWLLKESGRGVSVISCVPTGESTKLQSTVPTPWSHRWPWLNPVGQKTKEKGMHGKGPSRKEEGWTEVEDGA